MIYLVTGGSGSGKSAYAEDLVRQSAAEKRYYLATMEIFGEEGKKKVERHQKLREGKGMITIECPRGLSKLVLSSRKEKRDEENAVVLLECMGNLAANELFSGESGMDAFVFSRARRAAKRIKEGILRLEEQCGLLVVVSCEVFSDGIDYGEDTNAYIWLMGEMNCWLAQKAERVVEVVYGIGCVWK